MVRKVYFSFDYDRDIKSGRANQPKNSWVTKQNGEATFIDASLWEKTTPKGRSAIKKLIDDGLIGTSVTAVLIGAETYKSECVKYEIEESYKRPNGLLGIYIHNVKDLAGKTDTKGKNPFDYADVAGTRYPTYDWILDEGYENIATWVEEAAKAAGRD